MAHNNTLLHERTKKTILEHDSDDDDDHILDGESDDDEDSQKDQPGADKNEYFLSKHATATSTFSATNGGGDTSSPAVKDEPSSSQQPRQRRGRQTWENKLERLVQHIPQDSKSATSAMLDSRLASFSPRWRNYIIRFTFSVLMFSGAVLMIYLGPLAIIVVCVLGHIRCFQEIIAIGHAVYRMQALPWFRTISWYFLLVSSYFFAGRNVIEAMGTFLQKDNFLNPLIKYHHFISFCLYILGFVMFVLSLRHGYYFRQFSLFAWTHIALLIVDVTAFTLISNMFQGLIWWIVPVMMVVINDIMAYLFGFFFGRTPLIKVSPKKTWEGFIGGALSTVVISVLMSYALIHYQYFICPVEFDERRRQFLMQCDNEQIPPTFRLQTYHLGDKLSITCYPFLLHSIVLSIFASLIGPFGGFFASGFKRSCRVKDFGGVIPGHGGLTDRLDCQVLMTLFVQVYIKTFIRPSSPYSILGRISAMDVDDQVSVYQSLGKLLVERGIINTTVELPVNGMMPSMSSLLLNATNMTRP